MTRRKRVLRAMQNLGAGDYNPLQRVRVIATNVGRRNWFGSGESHSCCGNYGDPGC